MLNAPPGLDITGGKPLDTPHGPAVFVPLAWLAPGQLALVCADRCRQRIGSGANVNHVMQEAVRLTGECGFSHDTAGKALRRLRQYGAAAGAGF